MNLRTIWALHMAMSFSERMRRTREWAAQWVAAALPVRIRYWVTLQEIAKATEHQRNVMGTPLEDILQALDRPKVVR